MAIYLAQHGKSASKDVDPSRGLTDQGAVEVKSVASLLGQGDIPISGVQHSGKLRAQQTAELYAKEINPNQGVRLCQGINPLDDVTVFAKQLDAEANQLYVGHLPFMQRLVSFLVADDQEASLVEFQNGGVVCLDFDGLKNSWFIKWIVVPECLPQQF
jgi:phosphohistidine phosphatase